MAEYIEREAAIKAIFDSDPNGIRRALGFNVGQIEEALRVVPAVSVPQWISVKDRLPDVAGMYIVTACDEWCSHGEGIWYDTVVVVAEYSGGCWNWNDNGTDYDIDDLVTHWMPLPEPPKGDADNG